MKPHAGRYRAANGGPGTLDLRLELFPRADRHGSEGILSGDLMLGARTISFMTASRNGKPGVVFTDRRGGAQVEANVRFGPTNFQTGTWGTVTLHLTSTERGRVRVRCPNGSSACDVTRDIRFRDKYFRDLILELDRVATASLPGAVEWKGSKRDLAGVFRSAGFKVRVLRGGAKVPDERDAWTDGELHEAMVRWRRRRLDPWSAYVLLASRYDEDTRDGFTVGIMFDAERRPSDPPREGCAVFVESLRDVLGTVRATPTFRREMLITTAHEIGHALNLLHSFDKGRPGSPSIMNYPEMYTGGEDAYYRAFHFAFDSAELIHLRHHSREVTEPGNPQGVEFASYNFLRRPARGSANRAAQRAHETATSLVLALELATRRLLTSEPIYGRVTLRYKPSTGAPRTLRLLTSLDWASGQLAVEVREIKRGPWRTLRAPLRRCRRLQPRSLLRGATLGSELALIASRSGDIFRRPGKYELRLGLVVRRGAQEIVLRSAGRRLTVRKARSRRERGLVRLFRRRDLKQFLVLRGGGLPAAARQAASRVLAIGPGLPAAHLSALALASDQLSLPPAGLASPRPAARVVRGNCETLLGRVAGSKRAALFLGGSINRLRRRMRRSAHNRSEPR